MFRVFVVVSGLFVAAAGVTFSLTPSRSRADFTYVNPSGINTLDPAAMTWTNDIRIAINIWAGLTVYDPGLGGPVAGAADWPVVSADGLRYTFSIRADARWSNGDKVTARDFVRGWRRAMEPGSAGDYVYFLTDFIAGAREYYEWRQAGVSELGELEKGLAGWRAALDRHVGEMAERFSRVGVEAVDADTLVVRLRRRCPYFLELCAFPVFGPIHESVELLREGIEGRPVSEDGLVVYDPQWTKPDYRRNGYPGLVSNGVYRLGEWTFKDRLRLAVNPYYRGREGVACKTVDMLALGDINTAIMAYESGDVDFLPETNVTYDHELVRLATTGERPDFHNEAVFGTYYYLFNCADAEFEGRVNPFVDSRVRAAFCLAVDKRLIAEKVVRRGERPTDNIVPRGTIEGYRSPEGLGFDPDRSRALLAEAGYPGGAGLGVIDLLYNTGFHHGKISDVLAEMWRRELGVTVVPRGKEVKTFADDRRNRRFMIARAGWYGDYGDPTTFLNVFATGNGNNDAGFSDTQVDALLARAEGEGDESRRMAMLAEAEGVLIREAFPALPLFQYTQLLAIKPYVDGLRPNARLIFRFGDVLVGR